MATFDDVRRLGMELPEVVESTSYGTPALKVRKKGFCRMWGEREHRRDQVFDTEVLVLFCDLEVKAVLLENHPDALFTVPHYDGYGSVLVRLADVDLDDLAEWLEESYRTKAPDTLVRQLRRRVSRPASGEDRYSPARRAGKPPFEIGPQLSMCKRSSTLS